MDIDIDIEFIFSPMKEKKSTLKKNINIIVQKGNDIKTVAFRKDPLVPFQLHYYPL